MVVKFSKNSLSFVETKVPIDVEGSSKPGKTWPLLPVVIASNIWRTCRKPRYLRSPSYWNTFSQWNSNRSVPFRHVWNGLHRCRKMIILRSCSFCMRIFVLFWHVWNGFHRCRKMVIGASGWLLRSCSFCMRIVVLFRRCPSIVSCRRIAWNWIIWINWTVLIWMIFNWTWRLVFFQFRVVNSGRDVSAQVQWKWILFQVHWMTRRRCSPGW